MRIEERHRQYRSLKETNPVWKVLARESAPWIVAFLGDLFEESPEVAMDAARARLVTFLESMGFQDPVTGSRMHINAWMDDGLVREQNQKLTITASGQAAVQFIGSLQGRELSVTASHLETVNDEMRRLVVTLSPDIEERQRLIDQQIADLEAAKQRLMTEGVPERSDAQKREHVRHVFNLAQALTQDFRLLEDEMRQHELAIHKRILDEQENRGTVLTGVLDADDLMRSSSAGQAFEGFYLLLGSEERSESFRAQVKRLISLGVSQFLSPDETRYLQNLVNELLRQSLRVIERRGAATESLRAYMLSGNQEEHRAIDRLLKTALQAAGNLRELAPGDWKGWNQITDLTLETGKYSLRSPAILSLTPPPTSIDAGEIVEVQAHRGLSRDALGKLTGFSMLRLAEKTRERLRRSGSRTIGELAILDPITGGIEEVLALIRIAKATRGVELMANETIYVTDERRRLLRVTVPSIVMRAEEFPEDLTELNA